MLRNIRLILKYSHKSLFEMSGPQGSRGHDDHWKTVLFFFLNVILFVTSVSASDVDIIASLAEKIPLENLQEDPLLIQVVDRVNSKTTYSLSTDKDHIILESPTVDSKKNVVVFSESQLSIVIQPGTHLVLRKAPPQWNTTFYFVFQAFVRNANDLDKDVAVKFGDQMKVVEYDTWSYAVTSLALGWTSCQDTVLFSCDAPAGSAGTEKPAKVVLSAEEQQEKTRDNKTLFHSTAEFFSDLDEEVGQEMSGRAFGGSGLCGTLSIFGGSQCSPKPQQQQRKPPQKAVPRKPAVPNEASGTKGIYYPAMPGFTPVFIPTSITDKAIAVSFMADDTKSTVDGLTGSLYFPSKLNQPLRFMSDGMLKVDPKEKIYNVKGFFNIEEMLDKGLTGGVHGSLFSGESMWSFVPDSSPSETKWAPNKNKQVWSPTKVGKTAAPSADKMLSGVLYSGVGEPSFFIEEGGKLTGHFVPADDAHKEVNVVCHGSVFYDKKTKKTRFKADKMPHGFKTFKNVVGAFMPDGIDLASALLGSFNGPPTDAVVQIDNPPKPWIYVPGSKATMGIFAEGFKYVPTPETKPQEATAAKAAASNTISGVLCESEPPAFFTDGGTIVGEMTTEQGSLKGKFVAPGNFYPDNPYAASNYNPNTPASFIPTDTIVAIMGILTVQPGSTEASFKPQLPCKTVDFVESDPKNAKVVVISDNEPPPSPEGRSLFGMKFPSSDSDDSGGIFIPEGDSLKGIFFPDSPDVPQYHGSLVPGKPGLGSTLYVDSSAGPAPNSQTPGAFIPDNRAGDDIKIHGILTKEGEASNPVLLADVPPKNHWFSSNRTEKGDADLFVSPDTPGLGGAPKPQPKAANISSDCTKGSVDGYLFSASGAYKKVFVAADGIGLPGVVMPEDTSQTPIRGRLEPDKAQLPCPFWLEKYNVPNFSTRGAFVPDGYQVTQITDGIMGRIAVTRGRAIFTPDVPSKTFYFVCGRPEVKEIWVHQAQEGEQGYTPPTPACFDFAKGFIYPGIEGGPPAFLPQLSYPAFVKPDTRPTEKIEGLFFAAESRFIPENPEYQKKREEGTLFANIGDGSWIRDGVHGVIEPGTETTPTTFVPDSGRVSGFSRMPCEQKPVKGHKSDYSHKRNMWITIPDDTPPPKPVNFQIDVGGGYDGVGTGGNGLQGVMNFENLIFDQFIVTKGRIIDFVVTDDEPLNTIVSKRPFYTQASIDIFNRKVVKIKPAEYEGFVNNNYILKRTKNNNEFVEIAVPRRAEKFIKRKKKLKINLHLDTTAGAQSGAGGKGTGDSRASSSVTMKGGNCNASAAANAQAQAVDGSKSSALAHTIGQGVSNATAKAMNGSNADAKSTTDQGGVSASKALAKGGGDALAQADALKGGKANAMTISSNKTADGPISSKANATADKKPGECNDENLPDEIVIDSKAMANAMSGNGSGASGAAAAQTSVKIDMAGLVAKLMAQLNAKDDLLDEEQQIDINIDTHASGAAGRSIVGEINKIFPPTSRYWKAEGVKFEPNVTLKHEDTFFYGFGSCPHSKSEGIEDLKTTEALVNYYLKALRIDCLETRKLAISLLVVEGTMTVDDSMLQLNLGSGLLTRQKLTKAEQHRLSTAVELSVFSKLYHAYASDNTKTTQASMSPDGKRPISKTVSFLTMMGLETLSELKTSCRTHMIVLTRNLLRTLRTAITVLNNDRKLLSSECSANCQFDMDMNLADRMQLMALVHFIAGGIEKPLESPASGEDLQLAFFKFYEANIDVILQKTHRSYALLS